MPGGEPAVDRSLYVLYTAWSLRNLQGDLKEGKNWGLGGGGDRRIIYIEILK
jgi:hypothetical protein